MKINNIHGVNENEENSFSGIHWAFGSNVI